MKAFYGIAVGVCRSTSSGDYWDYPGSISATVVAFRRIVSEVIG